MTSIKADVKHTKVAAGVNDPTYEVSKDPWNDGHTITVGNPSDIGNANAEGSSTELVRKDHIHKHPVFASGDLHTDLLPLSGIRAMTDDLDLAGNKLLTTNLELRQHDINTLRICTRGTDTDRHLQVDQIRAWSLEGTHTSLTVRPLSERWAKVIFQSWTGAAWVDLLVMRSWGWNNIVDIPRAGDITMLDQKMMTLGTYTDAQRPVAGTAGRWIFNTDDGMPNYDDGTDWRDINGNIT